MASETFRLGRRGVIILYATCVLAIMGVMSAVSLEGSSAALDANFSLVTTQMARYAADAGIEYALAAVDSELNNDPGPGAPGSPWFDATYTPLQYVGWMNPGGLSESEFSAGVGKSHLRNLTPSDVPSHGADWAKATGVVLQSAGNPVEIIASRFTMSFELSMIASNNPFNDPTDRSLSQANTANRVLSNQDALFAIRSRGIVRSGLDPFVRAKANPVNLLVAYATAVATWRIGSFPNGKPRLERVSYELLPANIGTLSNFHRTPAAAGDHWGTFPQLELLH